MTNDINIGEIGESLNNKADKDFNNLDKGLDFVIDYGSNENGYYRLWKSGFIEQWSDKSWNGAWTSLTFPKPFKDINYHISGNGWRTDSSPYQGFANFKDYTVSGCNIWFSDDTTSNAGYVKWYACGYTEIKEN